MGGRASPKRTFASRWGNGGAVVFCLFLFSLFVCWVFGTPSASSLYVPEPEFPAGTPVKDKLSVILPTYKEADNLRATISDLQRVLWGDYEIVVVDDNSQDGADKIVKTFNVLYGLDVRLITRTNATGLSSAVLEGMRQARGDVLLVMDADGQHPPEAALDLMRALRRNKKSKIALGSRLSYDPNWPFLRRMISWGATALATPLTGPDYSDPMTGLFAIRAEVYRKAGPLNATGFKIALELLIKSVLVRDNWPDIPLYDRVQEVGFSFRARRKGASKLGAKVMIQYAMQIFSLYYFKYGLLLPIAMTLAAAGALWILSTMLNCCCRGRRRYERLRQSSVAGFFDADEESIQMDNGFKQRTA